MEYIRLCDKGMERRQAEMKRGMLIMVMVGLLALLAGCVP